MFRSMHLDWGSARSAALLLVSAVAIWNGEVSAGGIDAERHVAKWCRSDYGLDGTTASVFEANKLLTFELTLAPEDLALMRDDPKAEKYFPARLNVGLEQVGLVGLRYKGGDGTLHRFDEVEMRPGNRPKFSLKVNFGKYVKGNRFNGLKRLNFHSMIHDNSLMRDRIAYGMYRTAGLQAPRSGHARVVINGEYQGVFAMVEQVDQTFIDEHIGDPGQGVLFKGAWPVWTGANSYTRKIKVDRGEKGEDAMRSFAKDLKFAQDSGLQATASEWCDLDSMLVYLVVDQVLCNWDGVTGFTAQLSARKREFNNHNSYWYQSSKGRMTLIPWDMDHTLRLDHEYSAVPSFYELEVTEETVYPGYPGVIAIAPACDPLIRAVALHARGRYADELNTVLEGSFAQDHLNASIDHWVGLLWPAVALDPHVSLEQWEDGIQELRSEIKKIHDRMREAVADADRRSK
ncbi:MAG: CotH kinase family protein [Planctomycetota bacterium]|jgi:hypothetical protein